MDGETHSQLDWTPQMGTCTRTRARTHTPMRVLKTSETRLCAPGPCHLGEGTPWTGCSELRGCFPHCHPMGTLRGPVWKEISGGRAQWRPPSQLPETQRWGGATGRGRGSTGLHTRPGPQRDPQPGAGLERKDGVRRGREPHFPPSPCSKFIPGPGTLSLRWEGESPAQVCRVSFTGDATCCGPLPPARPPPLSLSQLTVHRFAPTQHFHTLTLPDWVIP